MRNILGDRNAVNLDRGVDYAVVYIQQNKFNTKLASL